MAVKSKKGFYIGDICYVLSGDVYYKLWGGRHGFKDGEFEVPGTGYSFAVGPTAYGDGEYYDDEGNAYPVDAGVIGLVPLELVERKDGLDCGRIVRMPGIAAMDCEAGIFTICLPDGDTVRIDTAGDDDGEDW